MTQLLYLDHAATTPVRAEVWDAMLPYLTGTGYGNPSSSHRVGRLARDGLEQARREIASALEVSPASVIFTSGGTEADNLAILGGVLALPACETALRVAVSAIEHKAVLGAAAALRRLGGDHVVLPVDAGGRVEPGALDQALRERPALVSIVWVNNEIGVVQPIAELAGRCREAGVAFHSDAVQAVGKVPVSLRDLPHALITLSGHKVGASKGIGALVVPDRRAVRPLLHGGGQQFGIRPGTENVAAAVGLGRAVALAVAEQPAEAARLSGLRDQLIAGLRATLSDLVVIAEGSVRAPHIVSLAVPGVESGELLMQLDLGGVAASGGSACRSGAADPSHVLTALGVRPEVAHGAVRFSLGHGTGASDIEQAIGRIAAAVGRCRREPPGTPGPEGTTFLPSARGESRQRS